METKNTCNEVTVKIYRSAGTKLKIGVLKLSGLDNDSIRQRLNDPKLHDNLINRYRKVLDDCGPDLYKIQRKPRTPMKIGNQ